MMPGKNGFYVCREVKSNLRTCLIPVVLITALSDSESRIEGIKSGADDSSVALWIRMKCWRAKTI